MILPCEIQVFRTLEVATEERDVLWNKELRDKWGADFPQLFDSLNRQTAANQKKYHYYEWKTAKLLFETAGYLSLVGNYEFLYKGKKANAKRHELFRQIAPPEVFALVVNRWKLGFHSAPPDLFVYKPDYSDWYFCEVKGVTDRLKSTQIEFFKAIAHVSGKPVRLVQYKRSNTKVNVIRTET